MQISCGRSAGTSLRQQEEDNAAWLEECAVRLLCVLALDRFGDYVSDQVCMKHVAQTQTQTQTMCEHAECLCNVMRFGRFSDGAAYFVSVGATIFACCA